MDYKKKYKEALKRAKNLHKDAIEMENNMTTKTCEIIFPELKENEDERIRRNIIAALKGEGYYDCDLTNECIAWLEKQGMSYTKRDVDDAYLKGVTDAKNEIEIPFGAKDSELQEATYYIPKGFYSVLDGNKVIIKRFKPPRPQNN